MTDVQQALADAVAASLATPVPTAGVKKSVASQSGTPSPKPTPAPVDVTDPDAPEEMPVDEDPSDPELSEDPEEDPEEATDVALPEGYVAVPTVADKLATDFVLRDAEGEVEVPDLIVEYKANGKVRRDRLDKVVKLAQFGVYNEERDRKVQETERTLQTAQQERAQMLAQMQEYEQEMERLLTDDDYFLSSRDRFAERNSPEQRAVRAEREMQDLRMQTQMQSISSRGEQFYQAEVVPALTMIAQALPTITPQELEDRMAYAMSLHAETAPNGQKYLPASQYDTLRSYLVQDLVVWAQMQHAARSEDAPVTPKAATAQDSKLARAQAESQKAKRALGQATRPIGRAGNGQFKTPKPKPIHNIDDAMESATAEVLSSFGH